MRLYQVEGMVQTVGAEREYHVSGVLVGRGSRAGRPRTHGVESVDVREIFLLGLVQSAID